jgi:hypothetical protein
MANQRHRADMNTFFDSTTRRTAWSITAAFGTYFCMYAFRKPFTAASYAELTAWGIDFKTILITAQVLGYTISKFVGIKVVAEMPPKWRARTILLLIAAAELALLLFAVVPAPASAVCLFLNGLPLGMVFGLVLGFLEGRQQTEFLTAGLCSSFILADGVMKSLGAQLLAVGVAAEWMPFAAGLVVAPALVVFVTMLARIPPPRREDVAARSARGTMDHAQRVSLYRQYAVGLTAIIVIYLAATVVRSIRADFAPEIWQGLGVTAVAETFTYSEIFVALGVLGVCGATILIRDNRLAFFMSLTTCGAGPILLMATLAGQTLGVVSPFAFMVLVGLGLYLPYVTIQTTVFERLLAMTRHRGTIGFLMYVADSAGYLGYASVMLSKQFVSNAGNLLDYFVAASWLAAGCSLLALVVAWRYFDRVQHATAPMATAESIA